MIEFTKYHGAGNDFIMIDNRSAHFKGDKVAFAQKWCSRRFGIGSDGMIFIEKWGDGDFNMDFYNPDGSQSFCGNGSRCAVAFAKSLEIIKNKAHFLAVDGEHQAQVEIEDFHIKMSDVFSIEQIGDDLFIDTGSPHYLIQCDNTDSLNVVSEGQLIRYSDRFKEEGVNVNFIEDIESQRIKLRTYERGVENETLACGTGATAAALSFAYRNELKKGEVNVQVKGGELKVKFDRMENGFTNVWLIGPAVEVYKGVIDG